MSEDNSNRSNPKKPFLRLHGFQKPFHFMQVLSWIYFTIETLSFYILVAPSLFNYSLLLYIIIQSVFAVLIVSIITLAVLATKTDTTDPLIV